MLFKLKTRMLLNFNSVKTEEIFFFAKMFINKQNETFKYLDSLKDELAAICYLFYLIR